MNIEFELEKLNIKENDVVILKVPPDISQENLKRFKDILSEHFSNDKLILPIDIDIESINTKDALLFINKIKKQLENKIKQEGQNEYSIHRA
ncbi:hypothetical protein [Clostridium sp.]|uniref:hypothetical protein n=1 Tax=Clostridium sp. TaxID=1506 RepID=UPI0032177F73